MNADMLRVNAKEESRRKCNEELMTSLYDMKDERVKNIASLKNSFSAKLTGIEFTKKKLISELATKDRRHL